MQALIHHHLIILAAQQQFHMTLLSPEVGLHSFWRLLTIIWNTSLPQEQKYFFHVGPTLTVLFISDIVLMFGLVIVSFFRLDASSLFTSRSFTNFSERDSPLSRAPVRLIWIYRGADAKFTSPSGDPDTWVNAGPRLKHIILCHIWISAFDCRPWCAVMLGYMVMLVFRLANWFMFVEYLEITGQPKNTS